MSMAAEERLPSVLFVCTANICRSPMAEALFRSILLEKGINPNTWRIGSAGTWASEGKPAAPEVVEVLAARGLNVRSHRSRMVNAENLKNCHLVLTMETGHKEALLVEFRSMRGKVFTLSEMSGECGSVEDPIGGPMEGYIQAAEEIERLLRLGLDQITLMAKG
jgi:protein-tyrosine-phosphatase